MLGQIDVIFTDGKQAIKHTVKDTEHELNGLLTEVYNKVFNDDSMDICYWLPMKITKLTCKNNNLTVTVEMYLSVLPESNYNKIQIEDLINEE